MPAVGLAVRFTAPQCRPVDRQGRLAITPREGIIGRPFREGLAEVQWRSDSPPALLAGYIDTTGEMVVRTQYRIRPNSHFSEGLAVVYLADSCRRYGCIDKTGRLVFAHRGSIRPFHEGLAACWSEGKYGYLDRTGRVVRGGR